MGNSQDKYIQKLKKEGKKLLNCWIDETTILSLKKLKIHYQESTRGELIDTIIKKHLEYIENDENYKISWREYIEERLSILEQETSKQPSIKDSKPQ